MIINGQTEYGFILFTFLISITLRGLIDTYVYEIEPYSRDLGKELWGGEFIFDKYWQSVIFGFAIWGYVWAKICAAHVKVIIDRGEEKQGTLCRRIMRC